jgi:hypothetical protein
MSRLIGVSVGTTHCCHLRQLAASREHGEEILKEAHPRWSIQPREKVKKKTGQDVSRWRSSTLDVQDSMSIRKR